MNLWLAATATTTTTRPIEAAKLISVEMWAISAQGSAPTTVNLEWLGENSPSTQVSDTAMGVQPAHLFSTPPSSSSNRWWCMNGSLESDDLFSITWPIGTIVDVVVALRLVETEAVTFGDVPAGATIGTFYGNYLDGIASGKLAPIGLTTLP